MRQVRLTMGCATAAAMVACSSPSYMMGAGDAGGAPDDNEQAKSELSNSAGIGSTHSGGAEASSRISSMSKGGTSSIPGTPYYSEDGGYGAERQSPSGGAPSTLVPANPDCISAGGVSCPETAVLGGSNSSNSANRNYGGLPSLGGRSSSGVITTTAVSAGGSQSTGGSSADASLSRGGAMTGGAPLTGGVSGGGLPNTGG
ncbi:MAG TPA: hypothetical protein VKP30_29120, partial [Polyangiaceae bacterium]|nr:hypothetical protein [Polyangiaceae bacterium]